MSLLLAGYRTAEEPGPSRLRSLWRSTVAACRPQHRAGLVPGPDLEPPDPGTGRPSRGRRAPLLVATCLPVVALVLLSGAAVPIGYSASFLPAFLVLVLASDLLTVVLLVEHYRAGGGPRLLVLSWAYAWSACTVIPYALTFPGVITAEGLAPLAPGAASWFWLSWHVGSSLLFAGALMPWPASWHARLRSPDARLRCSIVSHLALVLSVLAITALVTLGHGLFPVLVSAGDYTLMTHRIGPYVGVLVVASLLAAALGLARREGHGLESWAFVALVAFACDTGVSLLARDRFTLGWYGARGLALAAAVIVLLALVNEATVLFRRSAATTAQLAAHNAELVETQALRDHLLAVVSHDLRAPLAGLAGYLELLDDQDLEGEQAQHMIQRSRRLARKLTLQVEDLLAVSTSEHRGLHVRPLLLDLGEQLEEAAGGFPDRDVVVDCPEGLTIHADPVRLQQVLDNLVSNAVKYGAEPVTLRGSDEAPSTAHPAARVLVEVADQGAGVPPEFIDRLFERYSRREHQAHAGSGLGLSVVRDLARAHGGDADYDLPGRAFRVWFPDGAAVVPAAEVDGSEADGPGADGSGARRVRGRRDARAGVLGSSTPGRHPRPALSVDRAV